MRPVIVYETAFVTPSDEEIRELLAIAKEKDCVVRVGYFVPYSGCRFLDIDPNTTFEQCYKMIHSF